MKWEPLARLGAVALALAIVVGASGYGITRGVLTDSGCTGDPPTDDLNVLQGEISIGMSKSAPADQGAGGFEVSVYGTGEPHKFRAGGYEWRPLDIWLPGYEATETWLGGHARPKPPSSFCR